MSQYCSKHGQPIINSAGCEVCHKETGTMFQPNVVHSINMPSIEGTYKHTGMILVEYSNNVEFGSEGYQQTMVRVMNTIKNPDETINAALHFLEDELHSATIDDDTDRITAFKAVIELIGKLK